MQCLLFMEQHTELFSHSTPNFAMIDFHCVVGHREGYPVSFFSLLPNPMKMIIFALIKQNPIA